MYSEESRNNKDGGKMKKIIILVVILVSMCSVAYADRIAELKDEGAKIQGELQKVQDYTQKLQVRLIEISGAIKELTPKPVEPKVEGVKVK